MTSLRRLRTIGLSLAVLTAAAACVLLIASWRWNVDTRALEARLRAPAMAMTRVSLGNQVPAPVQRYLRHVLRDGQPPIVQARARQQAEFFINGAWKPLQATQQFSASPPGFVWDARIQVAPLMTAFVRDAFVGNAGSMHATINALYTLVDQRGRAELDAGALQRLLGESLWFPTLLVPGGAVAWTEVNDRASVATITSGGTHVSLEFRFDDHDEVVEIAGQRFAEHNGDYQLKPWHVTCRDYSARQDILIPAFCEVAWINAGTPEPYWRGRIVEIAYEFAR